MPLPIQRPFDIFDSSTVMTDIAVERVLVFDVGDMVCGVPADVAVEVLPFERTTRLPGAPPAVIGLLNVRGSLLTVLDAHRLLERESEARPDGAIISLEVWGRQVGLLVDEVRDLVSLSPDEVESRESLPGVDPRIVLAVARRGNDHFVMLDLDNLLSPIVGK